MKTQHLILVGLLVLAGCNPFTERQDKVKTSVRAAEKKAAQIQRNYKSEIRKIAPYEVYSYKQQPEDPFRFREFLIKKEAELEIEKNKDKDSKPVVVCEPPKCFPPVPHPKQLLENYQWDDLTFVGTIGKDNSVALIKTPDLGVIKVGVGDYFSDQNGVILEIRETVLIVQVKLFRNGVWIDKKRKKSINR